MVIKDKTRERFIHHWRRRTTTIRNWLLRSFSFLAHGLLRLIAARKHLRYARLWLTHSIQYQSPTPWYHGQCTYKHVRINGRRFQETIPLPSLCPTINQPITRRWAAQIECYYVSTYYRAGVPPSTTTETTLHRKCIFNGISSSTFNWSPLIDGWGGFNWIPKSLYDQVSAHLNRSHKLGD